MLKTCASCKVSKPLDDYGQDKRRGDGKNPYCKDCINIKSRARYGADVERRTSRAQRIQAWRAANPEKVREYAAKSRAKNKDKIRARKAAEYAENKDAIVTVLRDAQYRRKYGISLEERDSLAISHGHCCAICGTPERDLGKRLAVDHDHESGAIRGLLCQNCNLGVGHFRDDPVLLMLAARYLINHPFMTSFREQQA